MQTILGAGGAIGKELARELHTYTNDIRLVSRNPKAVNKSDQLMSADLTSTASWPTGARSTSSTGRRHTT